MMSGESLPVSNPEPMLEDLPPMAGQTLYQLLKDVPSPKMEPKLLAELEDLRGEPIRIMNPHIIPCVEVSDEEVRSVEPLVSVWMITYNHGDFIAKAIEGVVRQETNFPFELVIGEDCSTDRTREIALEYQKKYPHIIRVQYARRNSMRNPLMDDDGHIAGDNGMRTTMSCRGKFVAYCEGDDYWTDMKKLQKQVDIMESHPEVGMCCAKAQEWINGTFRPAISYMENYRSGYYSGEEAWKLFTWEEGDGFHPATATVMLRSQILHDFYQHNPIAYMRLYIGDITLWLECCCSGICCMPEYMAVRCAHEGSATDGGGSLRCVLDSSLVHWNFYDRRQLLTDSRRRKLWRRQLSVRISLVHWFQDQKMREIYHRAQKKQVFSPCYIRWMMFWERVHLRRFFSSLRYKLVTQPLWKIKRFFHSAS